MDVQRPEEDDNTANDVTAVTSKDENRFAQRRIGCDGSLLRTGLSLQVYWTSISRSVG